MTIDIYSATGTKKGTMDLPKNVFEAPIRRGLMHQFLMLQQSNRRHSIAHSKSRSEVAGSTKKLFSQKGTGRARRGSIRSPLLRGGNKAFGPKRNSNFTKLMPKAMRRQALLSCLSFRAKEGSIIGLEQYPDTVKTKAFYELLTKLPVDIGRHILFVLPSKHIGLEKSAMNVPGVKTIRADYLNPEDVLRSRHIVFLTDAIELVEKTFIKEKAKTSEKKEKAPRKEAAKRTQKAPKKVKAKTPKAKVSKPTK